MAKAKTTTKSTAKVGITDKDLAEYARIKEEKRQCDQKGRALEKQIKAYEGHFVICMKNARKLVRGAWEILKVPGRVMVPWKEKYIEVAGVEAAEALQQSTPPSERLVVQKK